MKPKKSLKSYLTLSKKIISIGILGLIVTFSVNALNKIPSIHNLLGTIIHADGSINVWWPTNGAHVSDLQAFKAQVQGKNPNEYSMTWSVDGGQPNPMSDSSTDYPHKEASVDVKSWTWHGSGPYKVTFKAVDSSNNSLGEASVDIYTPEAQQAPTTVVAGTSVQTSQQSQQSNTSNLVSTLSGINTASADTSTSTQSTSAVTVASVPVSTQQKTIMPIYPTANSVVSGTQTIKAKVIGSSIDSYKMYWQVDGGSLVEMNLSNTNADDKEASINFDSWNWHGNGPYKFTFVAKDFSDNVIASTDLTISVGAQAASQTPSTQTTAQPQVTITTVTPLTISTPSQPVQPTVSGDPFSGQKLYVDPYTDAANQAKQWQSSRPADASQMTKIATQPVAVWLGGWNSDVGGYVQQKIKEAQSQGAMPTFVAYNIPQRDCGQYSAGGVNTADEYRAWIGSIANAIGSNKAALVLEPDALTLTDCLGSNAGARYSLLKDAVNILKAKPNVAVYIDAGHPNWLSADETASRLKQSGIDRADGFALNTSNFFTTDSNISFGQQISSKVGGKHFVIDTSRNGNGPTADQQWCNPWGRALGNRPTANTGNSSVDAFLWLKGPGGSDGNCNGGPSAGQWWADYALDLAKHAAY